jgi:hypothetical protein
MEKHNNDNVSLKRDTGKLGFAAIALNGVIGTGIFALPAIAVVKSGNFSPWLFLICAVLIMTVVLSFARAASFVRGASPMVRMNELSHQDDTISLQSSMRNVNDVPLDIQSINFSLVVNDEELFAYTGPVNTNIVANGTETWSVDVVENETSRDLLDSLQNGGVKSLPYSLEGKITTMDDDTLRFEHEGHIYPLPGRPGRFR